MYLQSSINGLNRYSQSNTIETINQKSLRDNFKMTNFATAIKKNSSLTFTGHHKAL